MMMAIMMICVGLIMGAYGIKKGKELKKENPNPTKKPAPKHVADVDVDVDANAEKTSEAERKSYVQMMSAEIALMQQQIESQFLNSKLSILKDTYIGISNAAAQATAKGNDLTLYAYMKAFQHLQQYVSVLKALESEYQKTRSPLIKDTIICDLKNWSSFVTSGIVEDVAVADKILAAKKQHVENMQAAKKSKSA